MANTTSSPSMLLPIPVVGVDPGPQYASDINNCLTLIDQHDHSPGYGVQITPSGLNISSDLPMGSNNLTGARSIRFTAQGGPIGAASDLGCLYEAGVDLYYNDGNGNQVRITQSGGVAGSPGSIANLTSPASASYVSANQTFVWESDASTPANLDAASLVLRNLTASSKGLTLSPPNALASDYAITLPALPASTLPVSISSAGIMSAAQITLSQLATALQQALNPAGTVIMGGWTSAPSGYLICDGSAVSRSTYSALYAAIGDAFGHGDGSTTFNVPDMRGMFPRGVNGAASTPWYDPDASSRVASATGGNTGNNVGSRQAMAVSVANLSLLTRSFVNNSGIAAGSSTSTFADRLSTQGGSTNTSQTLSGGDNETRPLNVYFTFAIKT